MSEKFFEVRNLYVNYGAIKALEDISLSATEGEIISLIGANGAGKSTLLKTICGFIKPLKGKINFKGINLLRLSTDLIVKHGITMVPEGRRIFPNLTVKENLDIGGYSLKNKKIFSELYDFVLKLFPRLKERIKQFAGTLSGGEQQMLAIGRALMSNPKLLLLDEPSMGLSPKITNEIFELIKNINNDKKITIILVEQNAKLALKYSNKAFVMETGKIVLSGESEQIENDPQIIKAYLGG
ncbi:MAG: ABC transporter ATP-binding protein [Proteobacteria bacterium]|nr:ABC transporter ATP-binding protein [Pseudomonadota bacterium]